MEIAVKTLIFITLIASFFGLAYAQSCTGNTCEVQGIPSETYYDYAFNQLSKENDTVCIIYFYIDNCQGCAQIKPYIEELEANYSGEIKVHRYEIRNNLNNYNLYNTYCSIQNIPIQERRVPLVAINRMFLIGPSQIREGLENEIKRMLQTGERICPLSNEKTCHDIDYNQTNTTKILPEITGEVTLPLIIFSGLIDGINPCAFAVLIFFLTYLFQVSNDKRKMLKSGVAYISAVYLSYLFAGFGLFKIIQVSGVSRIIYIVAAVVAIIAGIINIKDYFWYGKGFTLKIPESRKKTIQELTYKANIPAAIILGFMVSMFELPCTGGVYLAVIALLASAKAAAIPYLSVYNLMFILPLVIILYFVIKGMSVEHIENWRKAKRNLMKLGLGLLMVGLGIWMLVV